MTNKTTTSKADTPAEQLITDHIDIWSSAILAKSSSGRGVSKKYELYGIKKLRELILELAVRGKLVPQDANDEPALVLLEKATKEKAKLIKEKKVKKSKKLLSIIEKEKFFDLPDGWEWVRLGSILEIYNGNSINKKVKEEKYCQQVDGLPYIGTKDVGYGFQALEYNNGVTIPCNEPNFKIAPKFTVLICSEGGSAGKKCGITDRDVCFGNKLYANKPFIKEIIAKFILVVFQSSSFFEKFSDALTGIIGGISKSNFEQLVIALPSYAEQRRIVAKVDELMQLCDKLEQQTEDSIDAHATLVEVLLNTLTDSGDADELSQNWARLSNHFDILFTTEQSIDALKQTVLQLAVMGKLVPQNPDDEPASKLLERIADEKKRLIKAGEIKKEKPVEVDTIRRYMTPPKGWAWCQIDDISLNSEAGWSPKCDGTPKAGDNWVVMKVSAVSWGRYKPDENKALPKDLEPKPQYEVKAGDFLISRANTADLVARSVVVPEKIPNKLMMSDKIIRFNFASDIFSDYINLVNNSVYSRNYYGDVAGGTSSSMKNVSRNNIRALSIPLPPLAEQHHIVAKVDELMTICDQLKANLQQAQVTQVRLTDALVDSALA